MSKWREAARAHDHLGLPPGGVAGFDAREKTPAGAVNARSPLASCQSETFFFFF